MAHTQNLILRIVAQRDKIGSRELIDVAEKFGLSPDATRAAANRMARAKLLTKIGQGRGNLRYRVGPRGQALIEQLVTKVRWWHLAPKGQLTWDGHWLVVTFSISEGERGKRDAFRARLMELGFGLLSSGVWISPFDRSAKVTALIDELALAGHVVLLRCERLWMPGGENENALVYRVWGLQKLEPHYHALIGHIELMLTLLKQVKQGATVDTEKIFFQAQALQGELIDILAQDPCLPFELLPVDWPSLRAHELFHTLVDTIVELEMVDSRYSYLLYGIPPGMEDLAAYWPKERQSSHQSPEGNN
jgi:phenylacetic acid degradation operon negative regulatory protein